MDSVSVFKSLRELFPQVDQRILRALSIEHAADVNEAIEFILSDVVLTRSTEPKCSSMHNDNSHNEQVSLEEAKAVELISIQDDSSRGLINYFSEAKIQESNTSVEDSSEDSILCPDRLFIDINKRLEQIIETSDSNDNLCLNIPHMPEKIDETTFSKVDGQRNYLVLVPDGGCQDNICTKHQTIVSDGLELANAPLHADGAEAFQVDKDENISDYFSESVISDSNGSLVSDACEKKDDINMQLNGHDGLSGCSADICFPSNLIDLNIVDTSEALTSLLGTSAASQNVQIYHEGFEHLNANENHIFFSSDENSLELTSDKNKEYSIHLSSLATRSGHAIGTDLLENSIMEAKNSKKALASTLESMVNMKQEVELLEEQAKQVKEDILAANHLLLSRVEELQKIVKQSKVEKDMHAGEVYGERSILAAEARELQSRLLKISAERSAYLSVTEEIFRALEARKAAAQDEIAAANLRNQENEKLPLKVLEDLELMMDSFCAESQKLQQETEENNKLREFLIDRGGIVDSLQGEIAVICEDILSLKMKIDSHTPLAKCQLSSSRSYGFPGKSADHIQSSSFLPLEIPEKLQGANTSWSSLDDWEFCEK